MVRSNGGFCEPKIPGLRFDREILGLFRAGTITPRGAWLIADVDRFSCPFEHRFSEREPDDGVRMQWIPKLVSDGTPTQGMQCTSEYLRRALRSNDNTVRNTIASLRALEPRIFKARKAGRLWQFKTRPRDFTLGDEYLWVPGQWRAGFEAGLLTIREAMAVSYIESFSRSIDKAKSKKRWEEHDEFPKGSIWCECFVSNTGLGTFLGITSHAAHNLISGLRKRGIVRVGVEPLGRGRTLRILSVPKRNSKAGKTQFKGRHDA